MKTAYLTALPARRGTIDASRPGANTSFIVLLFDETHAMAGDSEDIPRRRGDKPAHVFAPACVFAILLDDAAPMLIRSKRLIAFQHAFFVICLAVPAYAAVTQVLEESGHAPYWYHRLGIAAMSLSTVAAFMFLPGLVLLACDRATR